ncbi:N-acyl homoserine lactonase family protein [Microbacterium sp. CJ77]|uniref:N-acyl homoserine lactonase family protein n=1 Tax=Microbacterium sp. CJ77 TaxID=2079201 RepID=UPI000CD875A1|nr:N-acyl homoserine lactonase family protein [Microbacterium sp. CJ77]
MGIRIHHIVTGELESSLSVSLLNAGISPNLPDHERYPFGFRKDIHRRDGSVTEGVMVPVPVWLIQGAGEIILVDTGLGDVDEVANIQHRYGVDFVTRRGDDQDLIIQLAGLGLRPEDVDTVILTHLHFDHIGNNELFTNARFIVQRDELPNALTPPNFGMFYYPEYAYKVKAIEDRLQIIDGDLQLEPGIDLIRVGGHTPGSMAVMVDTDAGRVCIAGDLMYNYRNLELDWPQGSFWDLPDLVAAYARVKREADIVLPAHDWKIRELHPTGVIG